jgi:hypothetical protein
MLSRHSFPTFRRLGGAIATFASSRRLALVACAAIAFTSIAVLVYVAHFLSRFSRYWPEMLCYEPKPSQFQLTIMVPVIIACGTVFLSRNVRHGAHSMQFGVTALFVIGAGWSLALVVRLFQVLSTFQFDAGCQHSPQWFGSNAVLEVFTTPYGGYLVSLILLVVISIPLIRHIRAR